MRQDFDTWVEQEGTGQDSVILSVGNRAWLQAASDDPDLHEVIRIPCPGITTSTRAKARTRTVVVPLGCLPEAGYLTTVARVTLTRPHTNVAADFAERTGAFSFQPLGETPARS